MPDIWLLGPWYGMDPGWRRPFEVIALREHPGRLTVVTGHRRLTYMHAGLHIPGRADRVPVRIEFRAEPTWETFGLPPEDYPAVYADDADSPHRMPDNGLCLFYPGDPPWRRWRSRVDFLDGLLRIVYDHLSAEHIWRQTGGYNGGLWVLDEAPHGFPAKAAA